MLEYLLGSIIWSIVGFGLGVVAGHVYCNWRKHPHGN